MQPQEWCERCFARDECFTLHRALEAGNGETSELGELFETCTSALDSKARGVSSPVASSHRFGIVGKSPKARDPLVIGRTRQSSRWFRDRRAQIASRSDGGSLQRRRSTLLRLCAPRSCHASGLKRLQIADRVVLSRDGGMTTICRAQIMAITEGTDGFRALMSTERPLRLDNPRINSKRYPVRLRWMRCGESIKTARRSRCPREREGTYWRCSDPRSVPP